MAYQTYTTEAVVCGSYERHGADKQFRLFTKDAGMLYAMARSVREERSKQRYALQHFSYVQVSLVRGKSGWRIGSVEAERNLFSNAHSRAARTVVVGTVRLLNQFLQGEDPHPEVFEDTRRCIEFALLESEVEANKLLTLYELRLLERLGYVGAKNSIAPLLASENRYNELLMKLTPPLKTEVDRVLVTAREASHL